MPILTVGQAAPAPALPLQTVGEMVISYEGATGWVNYKGQDMGSGHFALYSPEVNGRAMLHRAPESSIIEGNWSEDGCHGMWRLHLLD